MNFWEVKCMVTSPSGVVEHLSRVMASSLRSAVDLGEQVALESDKAATHAHSVYCALICRLDAVEARPSEVKKAEIIPFEQRQAVQ